MVYPRDSGCPQDVSERPTPDRSSSTVKELQQKYRRPKQMLMGASGRKEDEHLVASDAELDATLEVFHSIQRTCMELLKVAEQYQRRIGGFSQEESELGIFLRSQSSGDKTGAGKIMQATGKALCSSSQQRLSLRNPLCRLYQEVETFRYRAISDTWLTVNRMEQSRAEYRAALLWMKDVSRELDPDTQKQMEKFRKVQNQVRLTKISFDQLKKDVCQKVDLLGASRCNLLSHVLTTYQTTLLHFWEKTSHKLAAIHESFRGSQRSAFRAAQAAKESSDAGTLEQTNAERSADQTISAGSETTSDHTRHEVEAEEDSLAWPSELLGRSFADEGNLSPDWKDLFGEDKEASSSSEEQQPQEESFLPPQLLDRSFTADLPPLAGQTALVSQSVAQQTQHTSGAGPDPTRSPTEEASGTCSGDLWAWFSLFAELDLLSDPDAVGRTDAELHHA